MKRNKIFMLIFFFVLLIVLLFIFPKPSSTEVQLENADSPTIELSGVDN